MQNSGKFPLLTFAYITGPNGVGMTRLGTPSLHDSVATGINARGQVVGYSYTIEGQKHAFITGRDGVGMTDLGALGGNPSQAFGINATGQVVGDSGLLYSNRAFITGPDGAGMTDLGTLGGDYSAASGINDAGQVVGDSITASGQQHAFITGPSGMGMTDLGTLGGIGALLLALTPPGRWWDGLRWLLATTTFSSITPSSPALTVLA